MFYTSVLAQNSNYSMVEVPGRKKSVLRDAAPSYFGQPETVCGVHVIVLCSDCDIEWNCQSFQGQFDHPDKYRVELPTEPIESIKTNYCISSSKKTNTILDAIMEIASVVKSCYFDDFGITDAVSSLKCLDSSVSKEQIWTFEQAERISEMLSKVDEKDAYQNLFLLLTMPKSCFEDFKSLHIPSFIEYVVIEQSDDPDMVMMEKEQKRLKGVVVELKNEVLAILDDTSRQLVSFKNDLRRDAEFYNNAKQVETDVDSLLGSIEKTKGNIKKLDDSDIFSR